MKNICTSLILTFLIFNTFQNFGYSQKANVKTLRALCAEDKYTEAYQLVNSKSFKYKNDEREQYLYLYSFTCKELYQANPELNSPYRNEGIRFARLLISSTYSGKALPASQIIGFLTKTIYEDVAFNIASKTKSDSVILGDFTTETIEAFKYFTVPYDLSDSTLYFIGSTFYNDGVFIITRMIDFDSDLEIITDRANRSVALFNVASIFFKALCENYNLHCDTYKMILGALGKTE